MMKWFVYKKAGGGSGLNMLTSLYSIVKKEKEGTEVVVILFIVRMRNQD